MENQKPKSHSSSSDTDLSRKEKSSVLRYSEIQNKLANYKPTPKPSAKSGKSRRSTKTKTSKHWLKGSILCCGGDKYSDSSENEDINGIVQRSKGTIEDGDLIIDRLQQAVNELSHKPTSYEIESEILKWQKTLEIEQKLYEESGRPKFKYKFFRKNRYLMAKKHPLYSTDYENHRRLETRVKEFRFGASTNQRSFLYDDELTKYATNTTKNEFHIDDDADQWRTDNDTFFATFAILCSTSNFFTLPQACYLNGGFTFLLTYALMVAIVGQPLVYFEMLLGQYSLNGPMGFAKLHPYAKGLPYAIAFMCIVFGTAKSIYLAYCLLYSFLSLITAPGQCGWWWSGSGKCLPYYEFEYWAEVIKKQRELEAFNNTKRTYNISMFSIEVYFREVLLDYDWEANLHLSYFHWRLAIAYVVVCIIAYIPAHYNLVGKSMKHYLRHTTVLPLMVLILFFHQIFARNAGFLTAQYFVNIETKYISSSAALKAWGHAFELMLSSLGIGYGFHWAVSGRTRFDYRKAYKSSWKICGYNILIGLLSSLVVFCEVGIVGAKTGRPASRYHVFSDRHGISLVCFTGALLKLGLNTSFLITIFFLLFVIYGMWSQVLISDIILQWFENGYIIKGRSHTSGKRRFTSMLFVIGVELAAIFPYLIQKKTSVLASENIFGGSLPAYIIVMAEIALVVYLYGFARFSADLEIMTKAKIPTLFKIEIRYIVIPTIMIFMFPLLYNVFIHSSIYNDRTDLGWLFYFGLLSNMAPVLILILGAQWKYFYMIAVRKIHPEPFLYDRSPNYNLEKSWRKGVFESRFIAKSYAPSQTKHYPIRSELYQVAQQNMDYIFQAQNVILKQFRNLLSFKRIQNKWLHFLLGVLSERKITRMPALISLIMLYIKHNNNKVDLRFLKKTLEQVINLVFYSAVRKLQRMPLQELLPFLADELIMLTTFHNDEYHHHYGEIYESSTDLSEDAENNNVPPSSSSSTSNSRTSESDFQEKVDFYELHRRIFGRIEKSPQENRTLLTIRLKRGLGLPYEGELSVLKFLRRERAQKERLESNWTRNDSMPVDHFIPASISNKKGEKICYTIFHAVVIEGIHHYVLHKLPVPPPPIVRVTRAFVRSQPGKNLTEKFGHIIKARMFRNIKQIITKRNLETWPKDKVQKHLWKVSDRVDDDVYDFLDRILTCIVILVDQRDELGKRPGKRYYLTPRLRRKIPEQTIIERMQAVQGDFEITNYSDLAMKRMRSRDWVKLLEQPPDIVYHFDSSSEEDEIEMDDPGEFFDVKSSSGSSTSISSGEHEVHDDTIFSLLPEKDFYTMADWKRKSTYILTNERQSTKSKQDSIKSRRTTSLDSDDQQGLLGKVRHISAKKWSREHENKEYEKRFTYTEKEVRLHHLVDIEAQRRSLRSLQKYGSKSMQHLGSQLLDAEARRTKSFQSLRNFLSPSEFEAAWLEEHEEEEVVVVLDETSHHSSHASNNALKSQSKVAASIDTLENASKSQSKLEASSDRLEIPSKSHSKLAGSSERLENASKSQSKLAASSDRLKIPSKSHSKVASSYASSNTLKSQSKGFASSDRLENDDLNLTFYTIGKTLIVDRTGGITARSDGRSHTSRLAYSKHSVRSRKK